MKTTSIASIYDVVCWGSRLRVADANRLNRLIRKDSDIVGAGLDSLMAVSERTTLSKLHVVSGQCLPPAP